VRLEFALDLEAILVTGFVRQTSRRLWLSMVVTMSPDGGRNREAVVAVVV
jgi:hypothetical protein